jgi:hypothetical protein
MYANHPTSFNRIFYSKNIIVYHKNNEFFSIQIRPCDYFPKDINIDTIKELYINNGEVFLEMLISLYDESRKST